MRAFTRLVERAADAAAEQRQACAGEEDRPLGAYAGILVTYGTAVAAAALVIRRSRRPVPNGMGATDLLLGAVATFRLSRLITKDALTATIRAPFTRFEGSAGEGEVSEEVRGTGVRHAVGELVTCPFCVAQWIATAYAVGLVLVPRLTRLTAGVLTIVSASDLLQFAHAALMRTDDPADDTT